MFAKSSGDLGSAYKVFEKMPERNLVTWTLMITRFAQLGCARDAIDMFLDMELSGYAPDRFTYSSVLSACTELGFASTREAIAFPGYMFRISLGCLCWL